MRANPRLLLEATAHGSLSQQPQDARTPGRGVFRVYHSSKPPAYLPLCQYPPWKNRKKGRAGRQTAPREQALGCAAAAGYRAPGLTFRLRIREVDVHSVPLAVSIGDVQLAPSAGPGVLGGCLRKGASHCQCGARWWQGLCQLREKALCCRCAGGNASARTLSPFYGRGPSRLNRKLWLHGHPFHCISLCAEHMRSICCIP